MTATPFFLAQSQQYLLNGQGHGSLAGTFAQSSSLDQHGETFGGVALVLCFALSALTLALSY